MTTDDYTQTGTLTGNAAGRHLQRAVLRALNADAVPPARPRYVEPPGYHQRFIGLEVSATKRMSNRWMARFGFSTNDHKEYFDDPSAAIEDPTPRQASGTSGRRPGRADGTGSGKSEIYLILPRYQFIANGLCQGPWGLNFGANFLTRQGFGQMFYLQQRRDQDPLCAAEDVLVIPDDVAGSGCRRDVARFRRREGVHVRPRPWTSTWISSTWERATVLGRIYDAVDVLQSSPRDHEPADSAAWAASELVATDCTDYADR